MYMMKRLGRITISLLSLFYFAHVTAMAVSAASVTFDPTTSSTSVNGTVSPKINVDSGTDQIAGTDVYVIYDPAFVEPQTVTAGTHFPIVTNQPFSSTPAKVAISAVVDNSSQYKTGTGHVATVTFKALKEGTTTLTFYCDTTKSDTSKIVKNDLNATNLIECSKLNTHTITIGTGGSTGITPTGTTSGSTTTTTGGTTYTSTQNVQTLPQSGVYENVVRFAIPGAVFLLLGSAMRFFFRT